MLRSRVLFLSALIVGCGGDDSVASESDANATDGDTTTSTSTGSTSDETATSGASDVTSTSTSDAATSMGASTSTSSTTDATTTAADTDTTGEVDALAPDFGLVDVNESSATFDEVVSPRDYLEKVSGWYFAHAT